MQGASTDSTAAPLRFDLLGALPEDELRIKVLMHLNGPDRRSASLVCTSWRAAVDQIPIPRLQLTTEQIAQPAFLKWLSRNERAARVQEFSVSQPQGCVGEVCMAVAHARRMLSHVKRYHDHTSQQLERVVAELPASLEHLDVGTPASVSAARLSMDRLTSLRSLVLDAGFYQELTGLPTSLQSLRLNRNVVCTRILGDLSGLESVELPIYAQAQLAVVSTLRRLTKLRLHLYGGVGLSLSGLARLAGTLQHLELCAYGAALTGAGMLAQLSGLEVLLLSIDLTFFGPSAALQETALLEALLLPPSLRRLCITTSCKSRPLPPPLLQRIAVLRPQLRELTLSPVPLGWENIEGDELWGMF